MFEYVCVHVYVFKYARIRKYVYTYTYMDAYKQIEKKIDIVFDNVLSIILGHSLWIQEVKVRWYLANMSH